MRNMCFLGDLCNNILSSFINRRNGQSGAQREKGLRIREIWRVGVFGVSVCRLKGMCAPVMKLFPGRIRGLWKSLRLV